MDNLVVSVMTSLEDLLSLKQDWENILSANREDNLYYSFDWHYAITHFCVLPCGSPLIICVREHHKTVAILPCCIVQRRPRLFAYKSIEFIGNIYSAYRGGIVRRGREREVAGAVTDFLLSNRALWDILYLEDIPESDPFLFEMVQAFREKAVLARLSERYANVVVDVASGQSAAEYWKSRKKNLRDHVHRYMNRMSRKGMFRVVLLSRPGQDIQAAMDHYGDIYQSSWKEPECDPLFHRKLSDHLLAMGKLRLFILYFKPCEPSSPRERRAPAERCECDVSPDACVAQGYRPIATAYCAVSDSYGCILKTAYHQDYASYSAGSVLTWFVIQWLLDHDRAAVIDFQKDGDAYKYKWGRLKEMHVLLKVANPDNLLAVLEVWGERTLIPLLRKAGLLPQPELRRIEKPGQR